MPDLVVNDRITIPDAELSESYVRSGGPGGQNVNKVASKVELRWKPAESAVLSDRDREQMLIRLARRLTVDGELIVTSERTRDQARNRDDARRKLAGLIREALHRPKTRRPTRPTKGSVRRRQDAKKPRGQRKTERSKRYD